MNQSVNASRRRRHLEAAGGAQGLKTSPFDNTRRGMLKLPLGAVAAAAVAQFPSVAQASPAAATQSAASGKASPDASSVTRDFTHARAVEAVVWSMPALSDVFFREAMFRDFGMRPGDIVVMSRPLVARHELLTANNQVNYAMLAYDLTTGPLVIEIPASSGDYAILGEICDNWQAPITMVGIEGPDAGKGGKYLLLPPGYSGAVPEGHFVQRMQGFRGTMIYRPVITGQGTMAGAVALGRSTRSWPLSDPAAAARTRVVDGWDKAFHPLPVYDATWFDKLAQFVNDEPVRERDKVMFGMLSSLGIRKGQPFAPDAAMRALLARAAQDAYRVMQHGFVTPGEALVPWWAGKHWMGPNPAVAKDMGEAWSFETENALMFYERAILPFFWANYLPQKLSGDQFYLMGLRDSTGRLLSGKGSYRLRVPKDVPVDKFWSAIVYSQLTKSFVPNKLDRVGLDSYQKHELKQNSDGSLDIYLGNAAPKGFESNWLPSAGHDFFVIFRFYGPQKAFHDKSWTMPDIVHV